MSDMANIANVSENAIYLFCADHHPCGLLITCALSLNIVGLFGLFSNLAVIWVTIKYKFLHGPVNFLLALCSFFEILHQSGHFLLLFVAISGQNSVPRHLALRVCAPALLGMGGICVAMAFTGLDRLLCVLFPISSKRIRRHWPYLAAITVICFTVSARFVYKFFKAERHLPPNLWILGALGDLISDQPDRIYGYMSLTLNTFTILIYMLVGLLFHFNISVKTGGQTDQISWRLFRSLSLIISVNIGGYFLLFLFVMAFLPLISSVLSHLQLELAMFFLSTLLNSSAASSGPILYGTSKEYRRAFFCELARLLKMFDSPTPSTPATPMVMENIPKIRTISIVPINSAKANKIFPKY